MDRDGGNRAADERAGISERRRAGAMWDELDAYVHAAIGQTPGGAAAYLKNCNPTWNAVGRVTFHLAENKRNPAYPFAFLATYTNRISEQGKVQHLPLGRALEEYAGAKNRRRWRRCFRRFNARPNRANWRANCWIPAPFFIRRFGDRIRPLRSCRTSPFLSKAAWSSAFRIGGRQAVRRVRKSACASARPRETCWARRACWISR